MVPLWTCRDVGIESVSPTVTVSCLPFRDVSPGPPVPLSPSVSPHLPVDPLGPSPNSRPLLLLGSLRGRSRKGPIWRGQERVLTDSFPFRSRTLRPCSEEGFLKVLGTHPGESPDFPTRPVNHVRPHRSYRVPVTNVGSCPWSSRRIEEEVVKVEDGSGVGGRSDTEIRHCTGR